ncbi:MAG: hypothetical protein A2136_09420 [Chloroflexi bacterium RBG_16_54_11]|nr:MAG: hypothetical protein A2136_09420 [Chloroflexi bacterium RBG_16_54_11]
MISLSLVIFLTLEMIKRLFDWAPRDIAYWEKLYQRGLRRFIGWYGVLISGGMLFIVFGLVTAFLWLKSALRAGLTSSSWFYLLFQLIFVALVCLVFGILNSLITWVVEERLYRKYKARSENKAN